MSAPLDKGQGWKGIGLINFRRIVLCAVAFVFVLSGGIFTGAAAVAAPYFGTHGSEAGQLNQPWGLAIDQEHGEVYVPERQNQRVSEFESSGAFTRAWGWGVSDGEEKLETCTTICVQGIGGSGAGQFSEGCGAQAVAVDNDSISPAYKDVYTVDWCNHRVQKFGPDGEFLLMFGGHVNGEGGATSPNICVVGEKCGGGNAGSGPGEFEWAFEKSFIAVGPAGDVYVGDKARVQIFEPSGRFVREISLSSTLSATGAVTSLAVDGSGDMFLTDEGVAGVHEVESGGTLSSVTFDGTSTSVESIALDGSGHLFVADSGGGAHILEYDLASGSQISSFGENTSAFPVGMAYSGITSELYVSDGDSSVWILTPPAAGPLIEPGSESATSGERGVASIKAVIDPEGNATSYRVEYVNETQYQGSGYAGATSTASTSIQTSEESELFTDHSVEAELTGLAPGATYHYRVVAIDSVGHTTYGPDQSFEEIPAALIHGPWVADLASTSATLAVEINPEGAETSYELELNGPSYQRFFRGSVEGSGYMAISEHIQGLEPSSVYHYRIVTSSSIGVVHGAEHTFTTQAAGVQDGLPDNRMWELVSPPNKNSASIEAFEQGQIQAASQGGGIAYTTSQPVGEGTAGKAFWSQILSLHSPEGWSSRDISTPYSIPENGEYSEQLVEARTGEQLFSRDLSKAIVEPGKLMSSFSLSPEAPERTIYLRDNSNNAYIPLVNENNVPAGTKYGGKITDYQGNVTTEMTFLAATPDLSHVVLGSPEALTAEAAPPECETKGCGIHLHLFEWNAGRLQLVSVLPNGAPSPDNTEVAPLDLVAAPDISRDGRYVVWRDTSGAARGGLYVRDMVQDRTLQIAGPIAHYETMSSDGSKLFYLDNGELYEFKVASGVRTDITADHMAGESYAGVQNSVVGASEDGSYVYFVATGVLAPHGVGGADNLYVAHDTDHGWSIDYVATLSSEDEPDWFSARVEIEGYAAFDQVTSRVAPNGRYIAFMSNRSLTGYDNIDVNSEKPDEEAFLYDAASGRLVCVSCDPTGTRPTGVEDNELAADRSSAWFGQWLAAVLPGWRLPHTFNRPQYQPRFLSDTGRLFFDSPDALVSKDTNGLMDVYEYEPTANADTVQSDNCGAGSQAYSTSAMGCISLISSGQSASESAFMDASETGDDVFFVTASKLVPEDYDNANDLYDAHVCSATVPCHIASVAPPPCVTADSCRAPSSPQPEIFGPAPSATFAGQGNLAGGTVKRKARKRLHTRRQLRRELKACRKRRGKKRVVCERDARRRFSAREVRKATGKTRGEGR